VLVEEGCIEPVVVLLAVVVFDDVVVPEKVELPVDVFEPFGELVVEIVIYRLDVCTILRVLVFENAAVLEKVGVAVDDFDIGPLLVFVGEALFDLVPILELVVVIVQGPVRVGLVERVKLAEEVIVLDGAPDLEFVGDDDDVRDNAL
jgi:hypothetical protein